MPAPMLLHSSASLAEAGFSAQQLETLTRSVEQKKQQLEDDIQEYIRRKQEELRSYERELVDHYRSMDIPGSSHGAANSISSPSHSADSSPHLDTVMSSSPEDMGKRKKSNRVHKREKELSGLVTPLYLPLLEATQAPPAKRRKDKKRPKEDRRGNSSTSISSTEQGTTPRDTAELQTPRGGNAGIEMVRDHSSSGYGSTTGEDGTENESPGPGKRPRRAPRKSSLRNCNMPRTRRKRVSIVIDDRVVLPAEEIVETPLTSPSELADSAPSSSAVSVADDMIDPRLIHAPDRPAHSPIGPVHHSLPFPIQLPSTSPTKHTGHTLSDPLSSSYVAHPPPQTTTRTFLDPSPPDANHELPKQASAGPIHANEPELKTEEELNVENDPDSNKDEEHFDTYVGGLSGSGVDNVDQTGSYGYPSSLGASYLESYMQSRPLSVRMAAAERAGLQEKEKRRLVLGEKEEDRKENQKNDLEDDVVRMRDDPDDDMGIMGDMEV